MAFYLNHHSSVTFTNCEDGKHAKVAGAPIDPVLTSLGHHGKKKDCVKWKQTYKGPRPCIVGDAIIDRGILPAADWITFMETHPWAEKFISGCIPR